MPVWDERAPALSSEVSEANEVRNAGAKGVRDAGAKECRAVCVAPSFVPHVWPHVSALIRKAIARGGDSSFETVEANVRSGLFQLWLAWDGHAIAAGAVTELAVLGGRKLCILVACGGAVRARWLALIDDLEAFARNEGCAAMRIYGRKGWMRVLPDYRSTRVVLQKELT